MEKTKSKKLVITALVAVFLGSYVFSFVFMVKSSANLFLNLSPKITERDIDKGGVRNISNQLSEFESENGFWIPRFFANLNSEKNIFEKDLVYGPLYAGLEANDLLKSSLDILENDLKKIGEKMKIRKINDQYIDYSSLVDFYYENPEFFREIELNSESLKNILEIGENISSEEKIPINNHYKSLFLSNSQNLKELAKMGSDFSEIFKTSIGINEPRYYLLLFQNSLELRATGGFIGSYAVFKLDNGSLEIVEMSSSYAITNFEKQVEPPEPIKIVNDIFTFRDSNFWFETEKSAQEAQNLYGRDFDGVIFVNSSFLEKVLEATGPIFIESNQATLTKENFYTLFGYLGEIDYRNYTNNTSESKDFMKNALNSLLVKVTSEETEKSDLGKIVANSLGEKDLFFWFREEKLAELVKLLGIDGVSLPRNKNYFALVEENLAGTKSSFSVQKDVFVDISCKDDFVNTKIKITYTHKGKNNFLDGPWRSYERFFVPMNSNIQEILNVDPELNSTDVASLISVQNYQTVTGIWVELSPGETENLTFSYEYPSKSCENRYISQPGQRGLNLTVLFNKETDKFLDVRKDLYFVE